MITAKERVCNAVARRCCDKLPIDLWATEETTAKLFSHFGLTDHSALLDELGVDVAYIEGPEYVGADLKTYSDGSSDDIWGVKRKRCFAGDGDKKQSYEVVVESPLKSAESVEAVLEYACWPDPGDYDYSVIKRQCSEAGGRAVFFMGDRLNRIAQFKPAMYLRGMEQILMDSVLNPEIFRAIIAKTVDFYSEYLTRILVAAEGAIDVVVTGDDFGTQNGLILSKQMWREFLYPGFKKFIDIAHSYNVPVMHHTCGGIYEIIPDMIEAGLDVLNPLQPDTYGMDFAKIKSEFGDKICFHGGISIQTNLPFGRPADVDEEVKNAFQNLGKGSGYIACTAHNIQADTPVENIIALFEAYRKYR